MSMEKTAFVYTGYKSFTQKFTSWGILHLVPNSVIPPHFQPPYIAPPTHLSLKVSLKFLPACP